METKENRKFGERRNGNSRKHIHNMKTIISIIITCGMFISMTIGQSGFYQFPYTGWSQYVLHLEAPPSGWLERIDTMRFQKDTIIDALTYMHLTWGTGDYIVRYDSGRVFQKRIHSSQMEEILLYDFTLNVGDTLHDYYYPSQNTDYIVTLKEKRLIHQDSLWYMELYLDQWTSLTWLEGIGDLYRGLIPKFGIEESNSHICTQNNINQTIAENTELFTTNNYDCDFIHGMDNDGDGFRDHFDCDDTNAEIYPGADEIPNNSIDEDCNGQDKFKQPIFYDEAMHTKIFPNPSNGPMKVFVTNGFDYTVNLYTMTGKLLMSKNYSSDFSVDNLASGHYIVEIVNEETHDRSISRLVILK